MGLLSMTNMNQDNVEICVTRVTRVTDWMAVLKSRRGQGQQIQSFQPHPAGCHLETVDGPVRQRPLPLMPSNAALEADDDVQRKAKNPGPELSGSKSEPSPIDTVTPAGRYDILNAIASEFDAELISVSKGGITINCQAKTHLGAAQAAREGIEELDKHIARRLTP
jgi:hypothetical protein